MGITSDASGNGSAAIIRLATDRDAEQIAATYAPNVADTIISFELEAPSADEMRRRIEVTLQRYPWLVCERQERVLGYAYAGAHGSRAAYQWSVDVSCGRVMWTCQSRSTRARAGRGWGEPCMPHSSRRWTSRASTMPTPGPPTLPNPASVGLHELVGFRPVGV